MNKIEIQKRFLDSLKNPLTKQEGGYNFDISAGVAKSASEIYDGIEYWKKQTFIGTATEDEAVDEHGKIFGVYRRMAVKSVGRVQIKGKPGAHVVDGTAVLSRDGIRYLTTVETYLDGRGEGETEIQCTQAGEVGNKAPGEIVAFESVDANLTSVTNMKAISGGFERESNAMLVARAEERARRPAHSGNLFDYEQWAKEVEGVGSCHAVSCPRGAGTVDVLISDYNFGPAQPNLIKRVQERIESINGRPVGADVLVRSFEELAIRVGGTVVLSGVVMEDVKDIIEADIRVAIRRDSLTYKSGDEKILSISRMEKVVLSIPGIVDCKLSINGAENNITVREDALPELKEVDITSA